MHLDDDLADEMPLADCHGQKGFHFDGVIMRDIDGPYCCCSWSHKRPTDINPCEGYTMDGSISQLDVF